MTNLARPATELPPEQLDLIPKTPLYPWEDRGQFDALRSAILADLNPTNIHQIALAERIVACYWDQYRSQRLSMDVTCSAYRKSAFCFVEKPHEMGTLHYGLDRADIDLVNGLTSSDPAARQQAEKNLEKRGIRESDIHAHGYLQDFAALEALERRPAKQDARLRSLMQDYRALQELDRLDAIPEATLLQKDVE